MLPVVPAGATQLSDGRVFVGLAAAATLVGGSGAANAAGALARMKASAPASAQLRSRPEGL